MTGRNWISHLTLILLSLLLMVSGGSAWAQTKDDSKNKRTTINFEDQLVEGQAQKPELFYMLQQRRFNYKRLIRLREDFLPEMRKTAEDITRKGSGT